MEHTKAYKEFKKQNSKKYVRYPEGAEMYSMSLSKFQQLAKDAKAIYKINRKPNMKAMKAIKSFCEENNLNYEIVEEAWLTLPKEDK